MRRRPLVPMNDQSRGISPCRRGARSRAHDSKARRWCVLGSGGRSGQWAKQRLSFGNLILSEQHPSRPSPVIFRMMPAARPMTACGISRIVRWSKFSEELASIVRQDRTNAGSRPVANIAGRWTRPTNEIKSLRALLRGVENEFHANKG
jgi:hypothetical protein